jgi:glutathione synthase/RimK-type ligase-like ATP-grasp enzyme
MDLAVASCVTLPEPDADAAPLAAALAGAGVEAKVLAWDDPSADFGAAKMCVIRSTWNYAEEPEAFAAWVTRTARATALWNGEGIVLWNMHKGYLLDLDAAGVPAVPTRLLARGTKASLSAVARELGAETVVVKPAVSGGSRATMKVTKDLLARGEEHLSALLARGDVLVQPYMASVEGYGERSLVWIDGEVTHAIRKTPRFAGDAESVSEAMPIAGDEAELAARAIALAKAKGELLYARVDMARDAAGRPHVMELELIEPSLFFPKNPPALARYVRAIRARLARS